MIEIFICLTFELYLNELEVISDIFFKNLRKKLLKDIAIFIYFFLNQEV
jgi:hypothetical protein